MVTIGDSFAIVAILGGICLSAWALMMAVALVFSNKARHAQTRLTNRPWASFFLGFGIWATVGLIGMGMIANPFPIAKLMGWTDVMALLSIAAVGASGLAVHAAERLRTLAPEMTPYTAMAKSAAVIVVSGLVPILGWFLIVPFVVFASTGAGIMALTLREPQTADAPRFML